MRTKFVSVMLVVLALLLAVDASAQKRNATRETTVLGSEIYTRNSFNKNSRGLSQYLIIPKGEWQLGMQVSHVSISSNNSEYMLLLNNIDANGSITKISPFLAYSYRNNRSIGLRMQYSTASGRVSQGDLDFLSDDLNFHIENLHANLTSYQAAVYHRSYIGLDNRGRIGLFSDIMLGYTNSRTAFVYNTETMDSYAKTHQVKLSLHPGIVVFAMNNVSMHVSMGIGGVSYNNTQYIKAGEVVGTRDYSKANFKLDVLDISMGMSIHL